MALTGCGEADTPDTPEARGAELAGVHGCTSCHGDQGQGGLGPPWQGLPGSRVELADGRVVVADDAFLRRAITHPDADQRAGYAIPMPAAPLADHEVDDLIAYLHTFGER
jgi:cytochrome c oxidase subunit 2